jgi:hypothetical protein
MTLPESRPERKPGLEEKTVADETLLYDPERETAFSLNNSATMVWKLCDGSRTVSDIADAIASELGVAAEDLIDDVSAAVRDLFKNGMVRLQ